MSIDPTATYDVYVIEYARSQNQPVASLLLGVYDRGTVDLPFSFVLARNAARTVLIDTGFMRDGSGAAMAEKFGIAAWVSPLERLAALGVQPEDVTDIVLTHAHYDHMGSIDRFPNARLFIQKRELLQWIEAMALPARFAFLTTALDVEDVHEALRAAEDHRLTLIDGDRRDLLPGIHVVLGADAHTFGSQYVVVETAVRGPVVVAGDCAYSYANLTGLDGNGTYIPLGFGVGSHYQSLIVIDKMMREVDDDLSRIIVLHDFERWERFAVEREDDGFRIARV
jgi:glyoxylase-like metal-dependent hydrolase (beta-lactamase superfamily II)